MKNLKITYILAMCLSFVPMNLEASSVLSANATTQIVNLPELHYFHETGDAGYLLSPNGDRAKVYLPSRTLGRWSTWSARLSAENSRNALSQQTFSFIMTTREQQSYVSLKITIDLSPARQYQIQNVEVIVNEEALRDLDLANPYQRSIVQMQILALCMEFCMFADQLQYNGTIAGRIGNAVEQVRTALLPILAGVGQVPATNPLKQILSDIVQRYIEAYANEYSITTRSGRQYDYIRNAIASVSNKDRLREWANSGSSIGGPIGATTGFIAGTALIGTVIASGAVVGELITAPLLLAWILYWIGSAAGAGVGAMAGFYAEPVTTFINIPGSVGAQTHVQIQENTLNIAIPVYGALSGELIGYIYTGSLLKGENGWKNIACKALDGTQARYRLTEDAIRDNPALDEAIQAKINASQGAARIQAFLVPKEDKLGFSLVLSNN